jgi:N-acyl-D-amino-acid deacylase
VNARRIERRQVLRGAAALAFASCANSRGADARAEPELVLRGGEVHDGLGSPPRRVDVGIRAGRIVALGALEPPSGARVLDVAGLCVAPGFVDIHTHSDRSIFEWPSADSRILQGCTTEITGNCGSSAAPRDPAAPPDEDETVRATWTDVRSYAEAWRANDAALNQALLVGHGTLRRAVVGDGDRAATDAELAELGRRLDLALEQGAIGLSTGLEYVPGIYTPASEIEFLARIVARRGGLYASHMRGEEEHLLDALRETLDVGRQTGVRVQVSHLKAAGRPHWGAQAEAIAMIERARAEGVDVMADAYPYTAYSTTLTLLLEPWSREGGAQRVLERLKDPELRARMQAEIAGHVARDPGSFDAIVVSSVGSPRVQECVGRNLAEIAAAWGVDPSTAYLRLLEDSGADVGYVGHAMSEENVARVLAHPLVMIGSDGRSMARTGRALEQQPHPRSYGTFARVLGHYCREQRLFDLPTAIRKMTSMPAGRARLADRGRIAQGCAADLAVFDARTVADVATFDDPQQPARGFVHVLVNGELVVEGGSPTGARPGAWL